MKKLRILLVLLMLAFYFKSSSQILPEWVDTTFRVPYDNQFWSADLKVDPLGNSYIAARKTDTLFNYSVVLAKYNSAGNLIFSIDTSLSYVFAVSIEIDDSMNLYAAIVDGSPNNILVLKYDINGNLVWSSTNTSQSAYEFQGGLIRTMIDRYNNIYVTGEGDSIPNFGNNDIITMKFNSSGVYQWSARYDHDFNDGAFVYLGLDSMQNVYVTGRSYDTVTQLDIVLLKYNSSGVQQWVQRFDGNGIDHESPSSFAVSPSGNCYIGGMKSFNGAGGADYLSIKYDSGGNLKWNSIYNVTAGEDWLMDLKIDTSENVYVAGTSALNSSPDQNYFTIKYDSSGNILWTRSYNSSNGPVSGEDANTICLDHLNNIYVTGYRINTTTSSGEIFTIKYDTNGDTLWVAPYSYSPQSGSLIYKCSCDADNNVYLSGTHYDNSGFVSLITLKYGSTVNVEEFVAKNDFIIYPNPTTDYFELRMSVNNKQCEIKILDVMGKEIFPSGVVNPQSAIKISMQDFSAGVYFVQVTSNGNSRTQKVVKY